MVPRGDDAASAARSTWDLSTSYGTVRIYEWSDPADADSTPILLLPGRLAGAPMWAANLPEFLATHRVLAVDALGDAGLSVQTSPMTTHSLPMQAPHELGTALRTFWRDVSGRRPEVSEERDH